MGPAGLDGRHNDRVRRQVAVGEGGGEAPAYLYDRHSGHIGRSMAWKDSDEDVQSHRRWTLGVLSMVDGYGDGCPRDRARMRRDGSVALGSVEGQSRTFGDALGALVSGVLPHGSGGDDACAYSPDGDYPSCDEDRCRDSNLE